MGVCAAAAGGASWAAVAGGTSELRVSHQHEVVFGTRHRDIQQATTFGAVSALCCIGDGLSDHGPTQAMLVLGVDDLGQHHRVAGQLAPDVSLAL